MPTLSSLVIPFALSTYLSANGLRKRSLSPSGAAAAFLVGFTLMSVPLRVFGVTMIVFYLTASKATKLGHDRKKFLSEEGAEEGGYRNAWQVLCNSFTSVIAATAWAVLFSPTSLHAVLIRPLLPPSYSSAFLLITPHSSTSYFSWCPSTSTSSPLSRALILTSLAHFACCAGDTFASELGILSRSPPRLVTAPWRSVPPGTNGGMSVVGTLASLFGGVVVGFTMATCLWIEGAGCLFGGYDECDAISQMSLLMAYGGAGGVLGSLIDSLLGATIQRSAYSKTSKMVLKDGSSGNGPDADVAVISGFNLLSNNQVNFVSSLATAAVFGALALNGRI